MSTQEKPGVNWVAVITMFFLCGMISFVTNLAAPMGVVWKAQPGIDGSNVLGMMGNMMNFLAYFFMGIPAGKMLGKCGYKTTAMVGIATGFVGVAIQFVSGKVPGTEASMLVPFCVYLLGAFISGFSVCMLNMVVNPMLNLLGGGGKRGNQLNMTGMTFNSLAGTATPMLVGALIGSVSADTKLADLNLVMYIAMAVFAAALVVLSRITIKDPEQSVTTEKIPILAPLRFRHCLLGVIAIFAYMGVEIGIPATLNLWLADKAGPLMTSGNPDLVKNAATIAGAVAGTYWFLMLVGRIIGAIIGGKVSSRILMAVTTGAAILLIIAGTLVTEVMAKMPVFTGKGFEMVQVPLTGLLFALCGLCTSIMWPSTFNLATEKLGKYTAAASGLFMTMVVGGGIFPLVQGYLAETIGYMFSYIVPGVMLAYMFLYSVCFSKPEAGIEEKVK